MERTNEVKRGYSVANRYATSITLIAAISENRGIGKDGRLLYHIPSDLAWFKLKTFGCPVIMGRKTYESLPGALPNRINIVITRKASLAAPGVVVVHSPEEALSVAHREYHAIQEDSDSGPRKVFVIGGEEIYKQFLPIADSIYLSIIPGTPEADTFFPVLDLEDFWTRHLDTAGGTQGELIYSRMLLERKTPEQARIIATLTKNMKRAHEAYDSSYAVDQVFLRSLSAERLTSLLRGFLLF